MQSAGSRQPYRALVIDDDGPSAAAVSRLLQNLGCAVSVCADPRMGVSHALSESVDLVCLDLKVPTLAGFEVYTLIRSHECSLRTASVPVVAITGFTEPNYRVETLAAGFIAHLEKPVTLTALGYMIETVEALRFYLHSVRYSRDEKLLHSRVDEMFPPHPQSTGPRSQGILGLVLAIEQQCTATLKQVLREGYNGNLGGVQQQVRRLAEFGVGIGAEHWAELCRAIGTDKLDNILRFERCVVLARAELDRVIYSLRERVSASPN